MLSAVRERATSLLCTTLSGDTAVTTQLETAIHTQHPQRYQAAVRQVVQHLSKH